MMIRFIGDVHGKFSDYDRLLDAGIPSIQVGDFGFGQYLTWPGHRSAPIQRMRDGGHRALRGNHDDPAWAKASPVWVPDGTPHHGVFCVGGAKSLPSMARRVGEDWWPDEELTQDALYAVLDAYEQLCPATVVSHDCPQSIAERFLLGGGAYPHDTTRTRQALDGMLYLHRPSLWVFGHWHQPLDVYLDGTRFVCLPELAHLDLDL